MISISVHLIDSDERPRLSHPTGAAAMGCVELRTEDGSSLTLWISKASLRQARGILRAIAEVTDAVDEFEVPAEPPEPPPAPGDEGCDIPF